MFSVFILAIKFDCLFLGIFQSFHCFVTLIFDKLDPLTINLCLKRCFKSLFCPFLRKDSLGRAKNVVFSLFCILVERPMGGLLAPPSAHPNPPGYATEPH